MKKKKEVKIFLSKKNQWKKFKYKDTEILFKGYFLVLTEIDSKKNY